MKTAMLFTAAFLTPVLGAHFMSCAGSHPNHTQARSAELGEEIHVFVSTNAHAGHSASRIGVHRFRGTSAGYWGAENRVPTTIVGSAHIEINGVNIPIPPRAIRDLAEVQYSAQIGFLDDGSASFYIRGGDAGFSYTAHFEIREMRLRKRVVILDESEYREESRF